MPHFMSRALMDRYLLDDKTRFWVELDDIIELYPIRNYEIEIDHRYENVVSLDLDTRVLAMSELFKYSETSNLTYLIGLAEKLRHKCTIAKRGDLRDSLTFEIRKARKKSHAKTARKTK